MHARSRLRPDALPFRRFVFGHIVDFMHAFATPSRELRLAKMRCRGCTCSRCRRCTCWLRCLTRCGMYSAVIPVERYRIRVRLSEKHHRRLDVPSGLLGTSTHGNILVAQLHVVIQICVFQSALSLDAAYDSVVLTPTTFRRWYLFPEEASTALSTQGFRSSTACKASGLSLSRSLRRPFRFPSEERVGSPPLCASRARSSA
jgi:hypothetical protein